MKKTLLTAGCTAMIAAMLLCACTPAQTTGHGGTNDNINGGDNPGNIKVPKTLLFRSGDTILSNRNRHSIITAKRSSMSPFGRQI